MRVSFLQLRVPGNDGTLKSTPFSWAPEVVPARNDESPAETENTTGATGGGVVSPTSNHRVEGVSEEEVWEFGVVLPPSKAVRDGVRFRGLNIFLYGIDETVSLRYLGTNCAVGRVWPRDGLRSCAVA